MKTPNVLPLTAKTKLDEGSRRAGATAFLGALESMVENGGDWRQARTVATGALVANSTSYSRKAGNGSGVTRVRIDRSDDGTPKAGWLEYETGDTVSLGYARNSDDAVVSIEARQRPLGELSGGRYSDDRGTVFRLAELVTAASGVRPDDLIAVVQNETQQLPQPTDQASA